LSESSHRRAFRILFLCLVCIGLGQSMLFSILPPAARQIGISPFQVSTIFATSATLWVFVSPAWGRRSDVWGRRPVILIGLLGYALSMASLAGMIQIGLANWLPAIIVYPLMVAARSLFALFGSGTGPASQAYVADRTGPLERTAGVALVNAAMGLGETVGPGLGALLVAVGLLTPLYLSAGLAVFSAAMIWVCLPEAELPRAPDPTRPRKMRVRDARVLPFLVVATSLQAVRATTVITFAFFLQDTLQLTAAQTVRYSGVGFVSLAIAGLFAQLIVVQRFRPTARVMMRVGLPLMLLAFALLALGHSFAIYLAALIALGLGIGLVRPGNGAAASLAVAAHEQGAAAGIVGGVSVIGNVFGPMIGTKLYQLLPTGPYLLNAAVMTCVLLYSYGNPRLRHLRA